MESYIDTTFRLASQDHPHVCAHADCVSFFLSGYDGDGRGFTLRLTRAQLPDVQQLLRALEALPELGEPFADDEHAA